MIVLKRVAVHKEGAFGVLLIDGLPICVTLEHTYDDQSKIVKIPPGKYRCTRSRYHRGGYDTFEIKVPGHSRILFHKGNVEDHSDGCVLLGEQYGVLNGKPAVLQSGAAFGEFMARTQGLDSFDLQVVYCP